MGNHPHNQWNRRSHVRHCLHVFCGLYLGYPTESTKAVNSSHCLTRLKSRTAWEGLRCLLGVRMSVRFLILLPPKGRFLILFAPKGRFLILLPPKGRFLILLPPKGRFLILLPPKGRSFTNWSFLPSVHLPCWGTNVQFLCPFALENSPFTALWSLTVCKLPSLDFRSFPLHFLP